MIRNYLKIAWRQLLKHTSLAVINILGLAIGIGACMIIFLYVHSEMTYDLYNAKADRIVRVTTTLHTPESDVAMAISPPPLADVLKRDFPEVESTVRLQKVNQVIKSNHEVFAEGSFYLADPSVFSVFSFDFLEGSATNALRNPNSIVITETISRKYFGATTALGKLLICNGKSLLITGVIKDRPANSDMQIDALLSTDFSKIRVWMSNFDTYTFILFYQKPDLKQFEHKLIDVSRKYTQSEMDADGSAGKYKVEFELQPLSDIHFSVEKLEESPKSDRQFSYVFSILAVFILTIALLNYINLATAKSTERAREIGIRKVSGASQFQLLRQFLFESFFMLTIACLLAIVLIQICLPLFNTLLQTRLSFSWKDGLPVMAVIFFFTFLFAGFYPAVVLSSFKPADVLKGNWRHGNRGVSLRKAITVIQFSIAAALIMGTTVIFYQMKFIQQTNLGFNKYQLVNIWVPRDSTYKSSLFAFQNELRRRSEIKDLTVGDGMTIGGGTLGSTTLVTEGKKRDVMCIFYSIDPHFLPVFHIPLVEGRNLSDNFSTDKNEAFLVNESFVRKMGWKSGIGQTLSAMAGHTGHVVGVVKDFYFNTLHHSIEPLVLIYNTSGANTTTIKINPRDFPLVKKIYKKYLPEVPLDYSFFDELINRQYLKDNMIMSLFHAFTVLAIFISGLGLYGLVSLIAVQRTKEIGIRKVLGASLRQIFSMMSGDFIKLVFRGLLIALPIAGFIMNTWLSGYAYHVELNWAMFLIPAIVVLLVALIVTSKEIIKTALINPVKSLRAE